jgi:hypothetical protein
MTIRLKELNAKHYFALFKPESLKGANTVVRISF